MTTFVDLSTVDDDGNVKREVVCTGSLLTRDRVLSASHCITQNDPNKMELVMGSEHPEWVSEKGRIVTSIKSWELHPGYHCIGEFQNKEDCLPKSAYYDVAIIQLSDAIDFNDETIKERVFPICLQEKPFPSVNLHKANTAALVVGYGTLGTSTATLSQVHLPIIDASTCQSLYKKGNSEIVKKFMAEEIPFGFQHIICAQDQVSSIKQSYISSIDVFTLVSVTDQAKLKYC